MSIWDILLLLGIPASVTTLLFFLLRKYVGSKIDLAIDTRLFMLRVSPR